MRGERGEKTGGERKGKEEQRGGEQMKGRKDLCTFK